MAAKNVPIGISRGRGRPRLADKALLQQRQFRSLQDAELSELDDDEIEDQAPSESYEVHIQFQNSLEPQINLVINHEFESNLYPDYFHNQIDSNYGTDSNNGTCSSNSNFLNDLQQEPAVNFLRSSTTELLNVSIPVYATMKNTIDK